MFGLIPQVPLLCVQVPVSPLDPGPQEDSGHFMFSSAASSPPSPTWCLYIVGARSTLGGLKRMQSSVSLKVRSEKASG